MDAVAEASTRGATARRGRGPHRPDSVFLNNCLYPRGGNIAVSDDASNRRHERRADVLELLKSQYRVQTIVDYSGLEPDGIFLEGTGAMVLDHVSRVAYTARSHRADTHVLERFCTDFGYEPMAFDAVDSRACPSTTPTSSPAPHDVAMIAPQMILTSASRRGPRAPRSTGGSS
jgi:hypothetical protein